jgi:hypothetical protein
MSEAKKLKKEWFKLLKAIDSLCEMEDSPDKSEILSMLLAKKRKLDKEVVKHYKIIQTTYFSLQPLNQNQCQHYPPS